MSIDFSGRLSKYMERHKISQYKLWKISGVSQATISEILSGKTSPTHNTIQKILSGLDVSEADFFADEINAKAELFTFNKLVEEINSRDIPPNIKELVIKFVNESRDTLIPAIIQNVRAESGEIQIDLVGDVKELVEKYKSLSPKQQEALKMVIDAFSRVQ